MVLAIIAKLMGRSDMPVPVEMRMIELQRGFWVANPGMVPWMPAEDWHPDSFCTVDGKDVRIVLIRARQPGTGAFRRLVEGIELAGFRPVVVCPLEPLEGILRRWGWVGEIVHADDWERREELWRPRWRHAG